MQLARARGRPGRLLAAGDPNGGLLHAAALGGNSAVVNLLLTTSLAAAEPQDLERTNRDGETAAFLASLAGHAKTLEALLKARANVDACAYNCSPLLVASHFGHSRVVACLLEHRADVNFRKRCDGMTPLIAHSWSPQDCTEILQALLCARADVALRTTHGSTALDYALAEHGGLGAATRQQLPRRAFQVEARARYATLLRAAGAEQGLVEPEFELFGIPPPLPPSVCVRKSKLRATRLTSASRD